LKNTAFVRIAANNLKKPWVYAVDVVLEEERVNQ
jgi:hypothetical protein